MIELNEWDISTSFDKGYISQYLTVYNCGEFIGTYYAKPSDSIESARINRDELLHFIENELSTKFTVKINKIKK